MREVNPLFGRGDFHQGAFDLFGGGVAGEVEALGEALDVGVDDDAFRFPKGDAEDDAGRLATATGQLDQFRHRGRDLAVVVVGNGPATGADRFGFVMEEAGRFDQVFQLTGRGGGEVGSRPVFGKQGRGDFVHTDVSALGAEDGGDEKLQGICVIQLTANVGISYAKFLDDFFETSC